MQRFARRKLNYFRLNALTFKRIEPEIIEFTARESLHLTRLKKNSPVRSEN